MVLVFALSSSTRVQLLRAGDRGGRCTRGRPGGSARCGSAPWRRWSLVLVSNNLGIMWVGIEATTLLTAFLICMHVSPASLEAMWKYLLMCSVGVAFAFIGTLLIGAAAARAAAWAPDALLWTHLRDGGRAARARRCSSGLHLPARGLRDQGRAWRRCTAGCPTRTARRRRRSRRSSPGSC